VTVSARLKVVSFWF